MSSSYAEVVVTLPVEGRFHYRVPPHLEGELQAGHRVLVPFGGRRSTAFVVEPEAVLPDGLAPERVKAIEARLDAEPLLPPALLSLCRFAADYYLAPVGEVLKVALPPGFTGASKLRFVLTPLGRDALAHRPVRLPDGTRVTTAQWTVLEGAQGNGTPKSKAPANAAASLQTAGWIVLRDELSARDGGGEVEVAARKMAPPLAEPFLAGAKNRRALYDLLSAGAVPLTELKDRLGPSRLRTALKRLVADDVVETRTVPKAVPRDAEPRPVQAVPEATRLEPTEAQRAALETLSAALDSEGPKAFLLHGVTGSGKTEVYLGTIERSLARGRGAIVLVPEIALTPQLEARFRSRFGDEVVVLHSGLTDAERRRRWLKIRRGEAHIALGPRSVVWAPLPSLGVVVVDEEHDASFKQHNELRYSGRDLALVRARQAGAIAILGSATPSLETLHLAEQGRVQRLRLSARVQGRPMPAVEIVNLSEERRAMKGEVRLLSRTLEDRLREVKARDEQAIIFLNRRGFNTIVHCGACDDVKKCPHCDVSLTFHRGAQKLVCHYCGFDEGLNAKCRSCGSRDVRPLGAGTERVVNTVQSLLPDLRILRLDRDVAQRAGELDDVLDRFRKGEADVLVGTQMVAKGHDFPRVTLVGIVLADASLAFPDFRAAERTFQLITQVAGRAGRAERPGRVVIQTLQPDHYALSAAVQNDVDGFYELERRGREEARYPPFSRLGVVRVESLDSDRAESGAKAVAQWARELAQNPELRSVGPAPAPIAKVRDRYRFLVLLFAPTPARLVAWMGQVKRTATQSLRGVDLIFDVDALDLL